MNKPDAAKIIENLTIEDLPEKAIDNEDYTSQLLAFAFYDSKSGRYDTPFYCQSDIFAKRHYKMVANDPKSIVHNFQEDFNLVRLGYFNINTGEFTSNHETVVNGEKEKNNNEK